MTDKPMKNGKKYVDSGFLHDMMDNANDEHYFVRAHVWPSMKTDLPHNAVVVLSVNSGAVIHASCEPCRAFDPRPVEHRQVSPEQINRLVSALGDISRNSSNGLSMWETQLKFTHENYDLGDPSFLQEKVKILCENLTPVTVMEISGT